MIQPLFSLIFAEMALIVTFVFKTPLRKLVIMGIDRIKRGQGPIIVKAVAGTIFVVMASTAYSAFSIQKRWIYEEGELTPTDQVLFAQYLLEASLMGFSLFLGLMIDRLHHYIRELRIRRKSMEAAKKQNERGGIEGTKAFEEQVTTLKAMVKQLESELQTKTQETSTAEANAAALKKQSEGFLLEYDRLLEENQNLRNQLQSIDPRFSRSPSKKIL